MITILQTILKIKPDAQVTVLSNDINRIKWSDNNPTNITKEQILAKQQELIAEYNSKQYQRDRAKEYPPITEQLDMMYWDKVNGTDNFLKAIQAVKAKYPKE